MEGFLLVLVDNGTTRHSIAVAEVELALAATLSPDRAGGHDVDSPVAAADNKDVFADLIKGSSDEVAHGEGTEEGDGGGELHLGGKVW